MGANNLLQSTEIKLANYTLKAELSNLLVEYINSRIGTKEKCMGHDKYNDLVYVYTKFTNYGQALDDKLLNGYPYHYNEALTKNRVNLMNNTLYKLNQLIQNDPLNFDDIKSTILQAISDNNALSIQYGKIHFSFNQGLFAGYSFFSALFKRTLFQSQANNTLEKCLDVINAKQKHELLRSETFSG